VPRPGGEADKIGNHFESVWTVEVIIDVFSGRFVAITVEPFDAESEGVEFYVETVDHKLQFHSVKRQKQGGDWSIAELCRKTDGTGRSILGDLFIKRHTHADSELRFVSATGANELRELSEQAEAPADLPQYEHALSAKLRSQFNERIAPLCNGDKDAALAALKSLEVILRGHKDLIRNVERRIDELFYRIDGSELRPGDVRRAIAEQVLGQLGTTITTAQIRGFLLSSGLGFRDWKADPTVLAAVARINDRYLSLAETELINSVHIVRQESQQINGVIADQSSLGVLLVAPGGYGKSCVLAQCLSQLTVREIPTLCVRMDSFQPCNTTRQLGRQLDLPASPAVVLAGVADNALSVLVIDQLDAMSLVSGRHLEMWNVFKDLCNEARSYPNMKVLLACRDFDLNHDHRLRGLGDAGSGFTRIVLGKLKESEICESLINAGHQGASLSGRELEILGVPFHLLLFLQGDPTSSFASVGDLYDRYWDRKRRNVRERLGREPHWMEAIGALADTMSREQVLFAPKIVVDDWADDADAMTSEHVLVEVQDRAQLRFFHESFFDYAYARRFCASRRSVAELLGSTEQHLFRRAQVRQILAYRREHEFGRYVDDVREILESRAVRFHIKRMIASGFSQIREPTGAEWTIVEPYLLGNCLPPQQGDVEGGGWERVLIR
jgi:hypothetical protein